MLLPGKPFWILTGDDYRIIRLCKAGTRRRFTLIGLLVGLIFFLCFVSSGHALMQVFHSSLAGVLVGIFFALMITNIYLLLLYTLSKTGFPVKPSPIMRLLSILLRLIFISVLALIISKPIETIIYAKELKEEIEEFKRKKIEENTLKTIAFFEPDIQKLKAEIERDSYLHAGVMTEYSVSIKNRIDDRISERDTLIASLENMVYRSDYFFKKLIILHTKYSHSWRITLFIVVIFLIPAALKLIVRVNTAYYTFRHHYEEKLVVDDYEDFKIRYAKLLKNKYGLDVEFSESYYDAPFNTQRIKDERDFLPEKDLIDRLYNG